MTKNIPASDCVGIRTENALRGISVRKAFRIVSRLYCVVAYLGYLFGFLLISAFPKNKYEWMVEGGYTTTVPPDPSADDTVFFATLVLIAIVISQVVIVVMGKRTWVRVLSGVLIVLALLVWAARFII
jgi:hypothetical protein